MKFERCVLLVFICLGQMTSVAQVQSAKLGGFVYEKSTGEAIPFASIAIYQQGEQKLLTGTTTNLDGMYQIDHLKSGIYQLVCTYIGYQKVIVDSIHLPEGGQITRDIHLSEGVELMEVELLYERPLIEKTKTSKVTSRQEIQNMAVRDISSVSSQAAGVSQDAFGNSNVRGSRTEGTVYFIDGIKMRGSVNLEQQKNGEVLGHEEYASLQENSFLKTESNPLSTFSSDVDVASYANIRRYLNDGYLPPPDAVRIEEMLNYFRYSSKEVDDGETFAINHQLVKCPWAEEHKLLRISINTEKINRAELAASNLVFLIDVSGSMNSADKLPLLQKSLRLLVNNLRKEDHVAIVVYASSSGMVLKPTPGDEKARILSAISQLQAGGSTAGAVGIELAYKLAEENFKKGHNNRVILATDGDFNVGISSESALLKLIEKKRESGVFLSVLGFGGGNYMDAKMETLADNGNGNYAYIDNIMEAKKVLVEEMGATLHVVAKDTKFQIEFNPAVVSAYRLIGYENRILAAEDFNDDAKDAGDIGAGHFVTALYEIIPHGKNLQMVDIDDLKYKSQDSTLAFADELATLKVRHKKPGSEESTLNSQTIENKTEALDPDLSFLAAIAGFGMILRESEFKGKSDYPMVLALANKGLEADNIEYRSEFIRLAELARELEK
jgi:Ca-activated chloride channel family protein